MWLANDNSGSDLRGKRDCLREWRKGGTACGRDDRYSGGDGGSTEHSNAVRRVRYLR